jgi:uncharacterized protein with FMN-binding domain
VRRALIATGITIAGLAAIAGYRVSPHSLGAVAAVPPKPSPSPPSTPSPDAPAATPSASPSPSPSPVAAVGGSFTGSDFPNRFGDVVVRVVITNGHITDVQSVQLPSDRARSAYISQVAGPMLRSEVLQAQSATIDIISGATYTSQSYAQSVESALQQAHMG